MLARGWRALDIEAKELVDGDDTLRVPCARSGVGRNVVERVMLFFVARGVDSLTLREG